MMGLAEPVAIVAHDAGAANIILAWLDDGDAQACRPVMAGPAARLWRQRFPDIATISIEHALADATTLLSGTGWASNLEHEARCRARALGLHSVAVIDHWVNYRERFAIDGQTVLPDEIWVTDVDALALCRRLIPEVPVHLRPNLYLGDQAATAGPRPENGDVLFVSEPARSDWGRDKPGEFQALDYLVAHAAAAGLPKSIPLRVRPHPSDPPGKYDRWIDAHPQARLDSSADLAQALAGASWVAGLQSYALVVAMAAGRPAIVALPPHAPPCPLPHPELVHLSRIVDNGSR